MRGHTTKGVSQLLQIADDGHPKMGYSITIHGEQEGGTMGGFITLTKGRKGFLTNYHVVRPSTPDEGR